MKKNDLIPILTFALACQLFFMACGTHFTGTVEIKAPADTTKTYHEVPMVKKDSSKASPNTPNLPKRLQR